MNTITALHSSFNTVIKWLVANDHPEPSNAYSRGRIIMINSKTDCVPLPTLVFDITLANDIYLVLFKIQFSDIIVKTEI